jgi:pimeloyl-[acyl-carrier protein] methyl ester esterase
MASQKSLSFVRTTIVMGLTLSCSFAGAQSHDIATGTPEAVARAEPGLQQSISLKLFSDSTVVTRDRISVEVVGSGPDIIFVPDLMSSREVWKRTAERLRTHYRLHLVQVAGFAGEPARENASGPVLALTAEDIAAYIKSAKISPVFIGHGLGGAMGMYVAAKDPNYVKRLLLIDTIPFFGAAVEGPELSSSRTEFIGRITTERLSAGPLAGYRDHISAAIGKMVNEPSARAAVLRWGEDSDRLIVAKMMGESIALDLRPKLARILCPVTVLLPTEIDTHLSAQTTVSINKRLYKELPGSANFVIVASASHFVMFDQPAKFDTALDAFLGGD